MKLSTKIRYGARAMLVLASHYGKGPLELHEIAKKESISLKYLEGQESAITGMKRISKPGRRIYVDKAEIPRVMGGYGIAILTTSKGIKTDDICRREGIGGDVLCNIW